jgi:hypothetical protein
MTPAPERRATILPADRHRLADPAPAGELSGGLRPSVMATLAPVPAGIAMATLAPVPAGVAIEAAMQGGCAVLPAFVVPPAPMAFIVVVIMAKAAMAFIVVVITAKAAMAFIVVVIMAKAAIAADHDAGISVCIIPAIGISVSIGYAVIWPAIS